MFNKKFSSVHSFLGGWGWEWGWGWGGGERWGGGGEPWDGKTCHFDEKS